MEEQIHRHDFFFILAIEEGDGEHQIDFTQYSISNYSVFILRPSQIHQLIIKKGSKGFLMAFDSSFYSPIEESKKNMFSIVSRTNYFKLEVEIYNRLIPILNYIFAEYSNKKAMFNDNIRANLDVFFIELFRQTKPLTTETQHNAYSNGIYEKLLELLDAQFCIHKQVTYYAKALNLTTYQINSITKKAIGKSCSQLIIERTILEAKRYLITTSNQVNEISYHLGYDDTSYFIRLFKKNTRLSPEVFRKTFK